MPYSNILIRWSIYMTSVIDLHNTLTTLIQSLLYKVTTASKTSESCQITPTKTSRIIAHQYRAIWSDKSSTLDGSLLRCLLFGFVWRRSTLQGDGLGVSQYRPRYQEEWSRKMMSQYPLVYVELSRTRYRFIICYRKMGAKCGQLFRPSFPTRIFPRQVVSG